MYNKIEEIHTSIMTDEGLAALIGTYEGESKQYCICCKDENYLFYEKEAEDGPITWKHCHSVPIEIINQL